MLCVPTYIAQSTIEGIGLFAAKPIARGTVIWRFEPRFDVRIDLRDIPENDAITRDFLLRYGYRPDAEPVYVLCGDNARFMNHASLPNADDIGDETIARVNIARGQEITCNYAAFDYGFAHHGVAVGWR